MKKNFTVRQGALGGVEAFLTVARLRSFRRAAGALDVTPSAVSQSVRALEARVGAALLVRTTRSVGLTEAGQRFLARAGPAFEELVDLPAGGFDAGIRLGQFIAPDMVVVRLSAPFPFVVVGSPEYLRRRNRPERIEDLRDQACLRIRRSNGALAPWTFLDGKKRIEVMVSGPLIAHDYFTLLGAAVRGLGLAQVPEPLAREPIADGRLEVLLTRFAVTTPGVFLYHPGKRQVLPKLRAFIEHVKAARALAPDEGTGRRRARKG